MAIATGDGHPVSRRSFLRVSLEAAVVSAGVYGIVEQLATKPVRSEDLGLALASASLPNEQYLFSGTSTITDNRVAVSVPPLYHEVITATLATGTAASDLQAAQTILEGVLSDLESEGLLTFTPAGIGIAVGWGLSYFQLPAVHSAAAATLPLDLTAPPAGGYEQSVLLPAVRFGTDPADVILEDNDVVFVMASDSLTNIATAYSAIFEGPAADLFDVTSIRKGFVDASQLGGTGQSLTKQFAVANGVAGAELIPDQAQLFLGFTSTQTAALGPSTIANFESLGMTNQTTDSYFAHGTTLALSHLFEDLVSWYGNPYRQRVSFAFRPRIAQRTPDGTLTIPESMAQIEHPQQINQDARRFGVVGHSASMQPVSRLQKATRGFAKGSAIPVRADFNTVDNPFSYSANPTRDNYSSTPAAGVHFLAYVPTSFYFERLREAMDGPVGRNGPPAQPPRPAPPWEAFVEAASISASHRQNFLIPPRQHRSFPLAELL